MNDCPKSTSTAACSQNAHLKQKIGESFGEFLREKHSRPLLFQQISKTMPQVEIFWKNKTKTAKKGAFSKEFPKNISDLEKYWKTGAKGAVSKDYSSRFPKTMPQVERFWKNKAETAKESAFSKGFPKPGRKVEIFWKPRNPRMVIVRVFENSA